MLNVRTDLDDMEMLIQSGRRLVLYGAGASARLLLQEYFHKGLDKCLECIVDANEKLDGMKYEVVEGQRVGVVSLKHFIGKYGGDIKSKFTLLITPYTALRIVDSLDKMPELDGVETYLHALIVEKRPIPSFSIRSLPEPAIPKVIHYIWIGGQRMPQEYLDNIETWKKFCPDYEIVEWNEKNYDFGKNRYTREALEQKQYMYATDYVRKDILYHYGGIYLDTDVEVIRPLDELLYNEAFIGLEDGGQLNSGSGLGAVKGHPIMKELMEIYDTETFVCEDGTFNRKYNTFYETSYMIGKGYQLKNMWQKIGGMVCLPKEVLMPESVIGLYDMFTENTLANHKINPYDKTGVRRVLERINKQQSI